MIMSGPARKLERNRVAIWQRAYSHYLTLSDSVDQMHRDCLRMAVCVNRALHEFGFTQATIQAGSAGWTASPIDEVSFEWQDHDDDLLYAYKEWGYLPEIHCWNTIPRHSVIIDFIAPLSKIVAREQGKPWTLDTPLAIRRGSNGPHWRYHMSARATQFATLVASDYLRQRDIEDFYPL